MSGKREAQRVLRVRVQKMQRRFGSRKIHHLVGDGRAAEEKMWRKKWTKAPPLQHMRAAATVCEGTASSSAMQMYLALAFLIAARGFAEQVNPIEQVLAMITDLQSKVISEGEASHKVFAEFSEWCEDEARELGFQIKTSQGEITALKATIEKESASIAEYEVPV